jgi:hypothetical protein
MGQLNVPLQISSDKHLAITALVLKEEDIIKQKMKCIWIHISLLERKTKGDITTGQYQWLFTRNNGRDELNQYFGTTKY